VRPLAVALALVALAGPASGGDLESHVDGLLGGLMRTHRIPGAVVVVVRDGEVALAKGYGVADLATARPVDPERTLFRVASVSKLFVATAVMQQVERGRLDLDADVNGWLRDLRVPDAFGAPITLRHLLTHTAGFDDRHLRTADPLEAPPIPLGRYLAARLPPRVLPPGAMISYSNHGYGLAGHLVEVAAGVPFASYAEREIFQPLGMTRSRFGFDAPAPADLARPYAWRGGRHEDLGFDRLRFAPAGALVTTGADIARFMLAQLAGGRLGEARILSEASAREMQRAQVRLAADLPGWCLGFEERERNGVRVRAHGGSWRGFGTDLVLAPDAGVGWFVSTNLDFSTPFMQAFRDGMFDAFFPRPPAPPPAPPADFAARAARYTGSYLSNRRVRSDFMKLGAFTTGLRVSHEPDDTLRIAFADGAQPPLRVVEAERDRFESLDRRERVEFRTDATGRATHLFFGPIAFDRARAFESPLAHAVAGAACAALLAATLGGWALGSVARRVAGGARSPVPRATRAMGGLVCGLELATLVGVAHELLDVRLWDLLIAVPPRLEAMLWLPVLAAPLVAALTALAARGLRPGARAPLARLHLALLVVAAWTVLAGCAWWRLWPFDLLGVG
jgi:CubicO group peptidase (beta-lactamase class C family)